MPFKINRRQHRSFLEHRLKITRIDLGFLFVVDIFLGRSDAKEIGGRQLMGVSGDYYLFSTRNSPNGILGANLRRLIENHKIEGNCSGFQECTD